MRKGSHEGVFSEKLVDHRITGRNQLGVGKLCPVLGGGVKLKFLPHTAEFSL
jgi:hypothetical protein